MSNKEIQQKAVSLQEKIRPLPWNKICPLPDFPQDISHSTREQFGAALKGRISTKSDTGLTAMDFFSIPRDLSDADLLNLAREYLEVEDLKEALIQIKLCLKEAQDFLKNYLHINIPKDVTATVKEFLLNTKSTKDILAFLRRSSSLRSENSSVGFGPVYCALNSIAMASWENRKSELRNLQKECEEFYSSIFEVDKNGESNFVRIRSVGGSWDEAIIITGAKEHLKSRIGYRGKSPERCLCKMIKKPERDSHEVIKDGFGLRFEVENEKDGTELMFFLTRWLQDNQKVSPQLQIKESNFFPPAQREKIISDIHDIPCSFIESFNASSHKDFSSLRIKTDIDIGSGEKEAPRSLEIQIAVVGGNNERKFSRHEIYEGIQKLSVVSRLFGSFSEKYLDKILEEMAILTGISAEKIRQYLVREGFIQRIEGKRKSKAVRYISQEHAERWSELNALPPKVTIRAIEKAA